MMPRWNCAAASTTISTWSIITWAATTGWTCCARRRREGCQAPSILLTGQGSYELDLAAMEQGVYDYLLKDQLNETLLERTIRYALERRQTEEELERRVRERTSELTESESRFRALAETTSAAIFIVQDGMIRYANPAARFVTGYLPEELLGKELWRLAHPAYHEPLREFAPAHPLDREPPGAL